MGDTLHGEHSFLCSLPRGRHQRDSRLFFHGSHQAEKAHVTTISDCHTTNKEELFKCTKIYFHCILRVYYNTCSD